MKSGSGTRAASARGSARSKYIILEHGGKSIPLVFSPLLSHEHVAARGKVKSAGFCELDSAGNWVVSGRSDSLSLTARPEDAAILNTCLFL